MHWIELLGQIATNNKTEGVKFIKFSKCPFSAWKHFKLGFLQCAICDIHMLGLCVLERSLRLLL